MAAPSIISRRYSPSTRLRLQVLFARAWEALADTYQVQAAEFVRRLKVQLPIDEALDRFFREVGVPASMTDTRGNRLHPRSPALPSLPRTRWERSHV